MDDFSQMKDEQKRAWSLEQALRKATMEESPGETIARAAAFHDYVFRTTSFTVMANRFVVTSSGDVLCQPPPAAS